MLIEETQNGELVKGNLSALTAYNLSTIVGQTIISGFLCLITLTINKVAVELVFSISTLKG